MTIGDALARATSRLAEAGVESARLESELLLAKACDDCARALLYAELDPQSLYEARQRFDPAGHYHRPDVFRFDVPSAAPPLA